VSYYTAQEQEVIAAVLGPGANPHPKLGPDIDPVTYRIYKALIDTLNAEARGGDCTTEHQYRALALVVTNLFAAAPSLAEGKRYFTELLEATTSTLEHKLAPKVTDGQARS